MNMIKEHEHELSGRRWWVLHGTSQGGAVEWEERWWEASDWTGLREMGAEKSGWNACGDAWREFWKEKIYYRGESGEPCVEREAHKWAHNEGGEEWEEKWGEFYSGSGHINKWADKWGKAGKLSSEVRSASFSSRSFGQLTPENIYFYYLKKYFLDRTTEQYLI